MQRLIKRILSKFSQDFKLWLKQNYMLVLLLVIGLSIVAKTSISPNMSRLLTKAITGNEIREVKGGGLWQEIKQSHLKDITAIGFDESGNKGIAISSDGLVITSSDGGREWYISQRPPLRPYEMVNAISIRNNRVIIGTGIEETRLAGIYEFENGRWNARLAEIGGITAASSDGAFMVGSSGLLINCLDSEIKIKQLSPANQINLYGIARSGKELVTVGEYGFLAKSTDGGQSWRSSTIANRKDLPDFYSVAMSSEMVIAGGVAGQLWRCNGDEWTQVKGLDSESVIYDIHIEDSGKEVFVVGGDGFGGHPFVLHSFDSGISWQRETIAKAGAVIRLVRSSQGVLAVTRDGKLFRRVFMQ